MSILQTAVISILTSAAVSSVVVIARVMSQSRQRRQYEAEQAKRIDAELQATSERCNRTPECGTTCTRCWIENTPKPWAFSRS